MSSLACELSWAEDLIFTADLPETELNQLASFTEAVMAQLALSAPLTVSLHITTDAHSQELNAAYRGIDAPTDILSFEADPLPEALQEFETPHLGDLVLAYHYTLAQAHQQNHPPIDEFRLLIIHGILHLLGYTHDEPDTQQAMWTKQAELLNHFGIEITVPDYIHGMDDEDDASA